jgi:hypothetical protein
MVSLPDPGLWARSGCDAVLGVSAASAVQISWFEPQWEGRAVKDHEDTSPLDEYDLDDTLNRQMSTSGVTGIVRELRQHAGDYAVEAEPADTDEP